MEERDRKLMKAWAEFMRAMSDWMESLATGTTTINIPSVFGPASVPGEFRAVTTVSPQVGDDTTFPNVMVP